MYTDVRRVETLVLIMLKGLQEMKRINYLDKLH